MQRNAQRPRAGVFTRPAGGAAAGGGLWSAGVNITLFAWLLQSGRTPRSDGDDVRLARAHSVLQGVTASVPIASPGARARPFLRIAGSTWRSAENLCCLALVLYPRFCKGHSECSGFMDGLSVTVGLALTVVPVLEAVNDWNGAATRAN